MAVERSIAAKGMVMRTKAVAVCLVIGLAVVLAVTLRSANRADAAGGNCYSETQGPTTPTICD
jgi:hypothetical protein